MQNLLRPYTDTGVNPTMRTHFLCDLFVLGPKTRSEKVSHLFDNTRIFRVSSEFGCPVNRPVDSDARATKILIVCFHFIPLDYGRIGNVF